MNNKTLERVAIIITVLATVVIAANFLKWYLGDLAEDPDVIFWVKVAIYGMILISCLIVGMGYYLDRKAAREHARYQQFLDGFRREDEKREDKKPTEPLVRDDPEGK